MRLMLFLYLCLCFLAGLTLGSAVIGLVNVVIFLAASLALTRLAPVRWEPYRTPFSLTAALGIATLWPVFFIPEDMGGGAVIATPPGEAAG